GVSAQHRPTSTLWPLPLGSKRPQRRSRRGDAMTRTWVPGPGRGAPPVVEWPVVTGTPPHGTPTASSDPAAPSGPSARSGPGHGPGEPSVPGHGSGGRPVPGHGSGEPAARRDERPTPLWAVPAAIVGGFFGAMQARINAVLAAQLENG